MMAYNEIQKNVFDLGRKGGIPVDYLKIFESSPQDGSPHVEFSNNLYEYIVQERGFEFFRKKTDSLDDFLFWIFDDIASKYAYSYELNNRKENVDSRRLVFEKKIQILNKINPEWGKRVEKIIEDILKKSPYNDKI
jgi:hypothetical protein